MTRAYVCVKKSEYPPGLYRSIKKVLSQRNISKVFSHFYHTLMVYVLLYMYLKSHAIVFLEIIPTYNQTAFVYKCQIHSNETHNNIL